LGVFDNGEKFIYDKKASTKRWKVNDGTLKKGLDNYGLAYQKASLANSVECPSSQGDQGVGSRV